VNYVSWQNTDPALPYPHDIAPGTSLSGFSFSTSASGSAQSTISINSIDHSVDNLGPSYLGNVLAPAAAPVPESSTFVSLGVGLLVLGGVVLIARRRARKSAS